MIHQALPSVRIIVAGDIAKCAVADIHRQLLLRMVALVADVEVAGAQVALWEHTGGVGFSISITVAPEECV